MGQELLLSREGNLLQSEAAFLQSGAGNKVGQELLQSRSAPRYYKVGQKLLQSGAGNLLQSEAGNLLQSGAINLFQSEAGNLVQSEAALLQSGAGITKLGKDYYKVDELHVITK